MVYGSISKIFDNLVPKSDFTDPLFRTWRDDRHGLIMQVCHRKLVLILHLPRVWESELYWP